MERKDTLIVNLFGAPGAGKSTMAAYVFAMLKMGGVNCELVTEFAKDKVWEDNSTALKNQCYVFGQQSYRLSRCAGQVDVIITDSPLPLSILYNTEEHLGDAFNSTCIRDFNSYNNLNIFLRRVKPYNPVGRIQTEDESNEKAVDILTMLTCNRIPVKLVNGDEEGCNDILTMIFKYLDDKSSAKEWYTDEEADGFPSEDMIVKYMEGDETLDSLPLGEAPDDWSF